MSKIDPNKLLISSDFYSVQGEGISSGVPSYFVRLGICNLTCGMSRQFTNQLARDQRLEDGEIFTGDLQAEGKATWTCDSTSQWLWRGVEQNFDYLLTHWKLQGIYDDIKNGLIHIIWTGGEPTIKGHQEAIVNFFRYWKSVDPSVKKVESGGLIATDAVTAFSEIETNGTLEISDSLRIYINQINCSPKLSNSGMTKKQRINPEAIKSILDSRRAYQFKFVISNEEDIQEMFCDYIVPFSIPLSKVVCMPGLDNQADFHERTQFVLEMAKKYKFRGLTRLHISAWDKTLNV